MNFDFNSIGNTFTIRVGLSQLSGRDKISLLNQLMEDLQLNVYDNEEFKEQWALMVKRYWV